jgi:hypothetical protein
MEALPSWQSIDNEDWSTKFEIYDDTTDDRGNPTKTVDEALRIWLYHWVQKGKENTVADALSRKEHEVLAISSTVPDWVADIEASYYNDTQYTNITQQLAVNTEAVPNYTLHPGILRYKGRICIGTNTDLRGKILTSLHASAIGGHSGIRATYQRVHKIFHWPHLKQ